MDKPARSFAILIVVALATYTPTNANAAPPDLCDDPVLTVDGDLYEDITGLTISRWCEPNTDPPVWDAPVCCLTEGEGRCVPLPTTGRCEIGTLFTCDYGEQIGDRVTCYQPGPSACDLGFCAEYDSSAPQVWASSTWACCLDIVSDIICTYAGESSNGEPPNSDCGGFMSVCNWGQSNLDGTITCFG